MRWTRVGLVCFSGCIALSFALAAEAANSMSNSLTGFTGNSTQAATQAAVGAAGLSFFSTAGPGFSNNDNGTPDDPLDDFLEQTSDDTVVVDGSGVHFGSLWAGDGGRNYMRTNDSDYATTKFVAEITFDAGDDQAIFFGLGAGDIRDPTTGCCYGTPDWGTTFSSASFWPETNNDKFTRFRTQNDHNAFGDTLVPGFDPGTHRFRMTFNTDNNQLLGEIDLNYAGGPFVADAVVSNFPIVTTSLFVDDDPNGDNGPGWPTEPSRIFFGGDDGTVFRDLSITVVPEPATGVLMLLLGVAGLASRRLLGKR